MKKIVISVVIIAIIASGVFVALGGSAATTAAQADATATPLPPVEASDEITVEAVVVPRQSVQLRFPSASTALVAEVLVHDGQAVKAGAALARLDTATLELGVAQAQAALAQAQASYDKLVEGATPEAVAQAEAQLAQANAQLRQTQGSVTQQDIAAAQAQLQSARAALAELERGPKTAEVQAAQARLDEARARLTQAEGGPKTVDVQAAQANLDQARAGLQAQRDSLSAAKTRAEAQVQQTANALRDRQAEYSRIYWENRELEGQLAQAGLQLPQEAKDREAQAQRAVANAETELQQAQVAAEQARQAEQTGIASAEAQVQQAQANLNKVLGSVDTEQLAAARAQVAQAQASLDALLTVDADKLAAARARVAQAQADLQKLTGAQRAGSVQAAQAGVANAQASLEQVGAAPSVATLAQAKAQVEQAEVALKQAALTLRDATLRAPIGGTVAELNVKVGEVPPTTSAAVVLADFDVWQIETTDLTELQVVVITEGAPVTVLVDALPGVELAGTVERIAALGVNKQGDITYKAIITLKDAEPRLRWNMTASVVLPTK